ncbi:hypothetical protein B7463_g625, partial [Scytalidium lignicola]
MSSDLLAEFDSFYKSQGAQQSSTNTQNQQGTSQSTPVNSQSWTGGGPQQWTASQPVVSQDIWGGMSNFQGGASSQQTSAPQDDIWSAFETTPHNAQVSASSKTTSQLSIQKNNQKALQQSYRDEPKPGVIRRPTLEMFSAGVGYDEPSKGSPSISRKPERSQRSATASSGSLGEVLFDATDEIAEEDDEEFGEFESVQTQSQQTSQTLDDIFGDLTMSPASTRTSNDFFKPSIATSPQQASGPKENKTSSHTDLLKNHTTTSGKHKPASISSSNRQIFESKPAPIVEPTRRSRITDNDWGDFAVSPSEAPVIEAAMAVEDEDEDAWNWDGSWAMGATAQTKPKSASQRPSNPTPAPTGSGKATEPPTNIPPPSVLLGLFSSLFDLPQSALFKAVSNQPISLKNRIMSDPSTIDFLRGYLLLASVAAHILAGRKFRWKRDSFLSQAMKIGPASAGGKGGMKLTGVDKAETTREDREAADVVRIWKDQLGRLRSTVATANSSIQDSSKHLTIPEINDVMHVKTQSGALTAPKPCLICGLKRDERIDKVDVYVEDSFGEWWTEHWGHRACKNFWLEQEKKLRRR